MKTYFYIVEELLSVFEQEDREILRVVIHIAVIVSMCMTLYTTINICK